MFEVDLMIISIGIFQFINSIFHWIILGLGTSKDIINYLKIIITILFTYFGCISYFSYYTSENFLFIIPIVVIAWLLKIIFTMIYIKASGLLREHQKR